MGNKQGNKAKSSMINALVTGGSQGVGRGLVEGLAEAGFRVFFTGRDEARLAQTATAAGELGGEVVPIRVDHTNDAEVSRLFADLEPHGGVELLVNNAWGGYERMMEGERFTWADPFWEQPLWRWEAMFHSGVRAAFVASQLATRSMLQKTGGLIINISFWSAGKHIGNTLYGMAKAATDKMTADMAAELAGRPVPGDPIHVISLYPGLVRTEKVMQNAEFMDLSNSESPRFAGRVVAALAADSNRCEALSGRVAVAASLARDLGVTDVDGSSPEPLTLADA